MNDRRYTEDEIAAIFARAAHPENSTEHRVGAASGMTLAELQEIGREVGLSPDAVARAAGALETRPGTGTRRMLGAPIAVARTVALPRALSDAEWERLVADLRTTFRASGHLSTQGTLREWYNGYLQALVEPTAQGGYQLRLQTMKESARNLMSGGVVALAVAGAVVLFDTVSGAGMAPFIGVIGALGVGMMGAGAAGLPAWARRRRRQFDEVAARLLADLQGGPTSDH